MRLLRKMDKQAFTLGEGVDPNRNVENLNTCSKIAGRTEIGEFSRHSEKDRQRNLTIALLSFSFFTCFQQSSNEWSESFPFGRISWDLFVFT